MKMIQRTITAVILGVVGFGVAAYFVHQDVEGKILGGLLTGMIVFLVAYMVLPSRLSEQNL